MRSEMQVVLLLYLRKIIFTTHKAFIKEITPETPSVGMKLERAMDVICTCKQSGRQAPLPLACVDESIVRDTDEQFLTIRFEYGFRTKHLQQKKVRKNPKVSVPAKNEAQLAESINPIHELLRTCKEQKCVHTLQEKQNKSKNQKLPAVDRAQSTPPLVTRSTWNLSTVAPLIQWLRKKGIRYVFSDWVNEFTNGERTAVVSQRGVMLSNRQLTHAKHYRCHDAFHGIHLQCKQSSINTLDDDTDWWKDAISCQKLLHNGILHSTYQKRTYAWTNHTFLHLTTHDSKTYTIAVEHQKGTQNDMVSLRALVTALSYHLSQHTKQQARISHSS